MANANTNLMSINSTRSVSSANSSSQSGTKYKSVSNYANKKNNFSSALDKASSQVKQDAKDFAEVDKAIEQTKMEAEATDAAIKTSAQGQSKKTQDAPQQENVSEVAEDFSEEFLTVEETPAVEDKTQSEDFSANLAYVFSADPMTLLAANNVDSANIETGGEIKIETNLMTIMPQTTKNQSGTMLDLLGGKTWKSSDVDASISQQNQKFSNSIQPTNLNQPQIETQPTNLNQPQVELQPTNLNQSQVELQPTNLNQPQVETQPTNLNQPQIETQPTNLNQPQVELQPTNLNQPQVELQPTNLNQPQVELQPTNLNQPQVELQPTNLNQPQVELQPTNLNQPQVEIQPINLNQPQVELQPTNLNQPQVELQPTNLNQPQVELQPTNLNQPQVELQPTNLNQQQTQFGQEISPVINSAQPQVEVKPLHQNLNQADFIGENLQVEDNQPVQTVPIQQTAKNFEQNQSENQNLQQNLMQTSETEIQNKQQNFSSNGENFAANLNNINNNSSPVQQTVQTQNPEAAQSARDDFNVPAQIVEQARMIRRAESTEMVINLKPEHLGSMTLKISVNQNGALNATFYSDNAQVRAIIENSLVQLKQELTDQGLKVEHVEVYAGLADGGLMNGQGQQAWQQNSQQRSHRGKIDFNAFEEEADAMQPVNNSNSTDGVDYKV